MQASKVAGVLRYVSVNCLPQLETKLMNEKNPWKVLSSAQIYKNPWITVTENQVIRPDGKPGIYGVVDCRVACGVVALTEENEVYLVGQFRFPTNHYSWEIIEGGADEGENPLAASKRELREEAGLVAEEWTPLGGEIHLSNCHSSEKGLFFMARGLTEVPSQPDGTEVLQRKCLPFEECMKLVHSGEIKDAMSIIGLARAEKALT